MGTQRPRPVVLDAGALIAVDRADRRVIRLLELADEVHVPAGALAQAWRNPVRQVRLTRVLAAEGVEIHPIDGLEARAIGQICAATGSSDVVDVSVVVVTRRVNGIAVTSDADDLAKIDPHLPVAAC